MISFTAKVLTIGTYKIIHLPKPASAKLPSRGIVAVEGTLNNLAFTAVLEPDGQKSHWFSLTPAQMTKLSSSETLKISIEVSQKWPEPTIPKDLQIALEEVAVAMKTWQETTTIARWDWIRWIRSTNNQATRAKRISNACDMLKKGKKRVCCFDRAKCTDMAVCKSGILLNTGA